MAVVLEQLVSLLRELLPEMAVMEPLLLLVVQVLLMLVEGVEVRQVQILPDLEALAAVVMEQIMEMQVVMVKQILAQEVAVADRGTTAQLLLEAPAAVAAL